ncbi:MAG: hypothetical protein R3E97_24755 [Candidatus Eisenbacteria bacterium]
MTKRTELFAGQGDDAAFRAVRDHHGYADIKEECLRLWAMFEPCARPDFAEGFSWSFHSGFWEMWLGVRLLERYPRTVATKKSAPDFLVHWNGREAFVEATVAYRGQGRDQVPDISKRIDDDDSVPFDECILRITSAVRTKATANKAREMTVTRSYVVAVNLPYPEAWVCSDPPLAIQACLGIGGLHLGLGDEKLPRTTAIPRRSIEKASGSSVTTECFRDPEYSHISAVVVASVNPFSSSYHDPDVEFLHNPLANHPLPLGWLKADRECWIVGQDLRIRRGANNNPS